MQEEWQGSCSGLLPDNVPHYLSRAGICAWRSQHRPTIALRHSIFSALCLQPLHHPQGDGAHQKNHQSPSATHRGHLDIADHGTHNPLRILSGHHNSLAAFARLSLFSRRLPAYRALLFSFTPPQRFAIPPSRAWTHPHRPCARFTDATIHPPRVAVHPCLRIGFRSHRRRRPIAYRILDVRHPAFPRVPVPPLRLLGAPRRTSIPGFHNPPTATVGLQICSDS